MCVCCWTVLAPCSPPYDLMERPYILCKMLSAASARRILILCSRCKHRSFVQRRVTVHTEVSKQHEGLQRKYQLMCCMGCILFSKRGTIHPVPVVFAVSLWSAFTQPANTPSETRGQPQRGNPAAKLSCVTPALFLTCQRDR